MYFISFQIKQTLALQTWEYSHNIAPRISGLKNQSQSSDNTVIISVLQLDQFIFLPINFSIFRL